MIKVGDYIRCGSAGIREVTEVIKSPTDFSVKSVIDEKGLFIQIKYIQKYANNLLDLIEVGDYVNDYKVIKITPYTFTTIEQGGYKVHHKECVTIKTILTKERFESEKYEVGE